MKSSILKKSRAEHSFFNESFYREKEYESKNQNTQLNFVSYEYVKKYFEGTQINHLINRAIKQTLDSNYLPENPFNIIGRMLLHESIFENIKIYYSLNRKITDQKSFKSGKQMVVPEANFFSSVQVHDKIFELSSKIKSILHHHRLFALWKEIFQRQGFEQRKKYVLKQYKITQICESLGGSMILKQGCPFSAEEVITANSILYMDYEQSGTHLNRFVDFVIEDSLKVCESSHHFFIKLEVYTEEESCIEWSMDNLIQNPIKVTKQLIKSLINSNAQFWIQYIVRVGESNRKDISVPFIRVKKVYVLVERNRKTERIHTKHPFYLLLTSAFNTKTYIDTMKRYTDKSWNYEEISHSFQAEQHVRLLQVFQKQQPSWAGWNLYLISLFEFKPEDTSQKQIELCIDYMINSPLGFLDELRHYANVAKHISNKSSFSTSQNQIYSLLQYINRSVQLSVKKEEHIYPETLTFFNSITSNLDLILERKNSKFKEIKVILNRVENLLKYLSNSFYQICFVQKGYLSKEMIRIENTFGRDGTAEIIKNMITYDNFLWKHKNLPEKTLNMNEETLKIRREFNISENQARHLLLAKYVKNYELYEKIYGFYWNIICGKKVNYPMSSFINILRNQAIRFEYDHALDNSFTYEIERSKYEGIVLYKKAADAKSQYLFYSLVEDALEDQKIKDYRTVLQLFGNFFTNDLLSEKSREHVSHMRKKTYLVSINSNIRTGRTTDSNFNRCKIFVDVVYHVPVKNQDIYRFIHSQIMEKIEELDKNSYGVLGVFAGKIEEFDEDEVFSWTEQEQKFDLTFLRYNSKRSIQIESMSKLIRNCEKTQSQILVKVVFSLKGFIKCCVFSFNFLMNKQWFINRAHTYNERVFSSFDEIMKWSNFNNLKKYISSQKLIEESKERKVQSTKNLYLQNKIDMIQFITESTEVSIDSKKIRKYSKFYGQLEQALTLSHNLFDLFQFLKIDKKGTFQISQFRQTLQLLEFYLFDKCLKVDRYIYSEGLSVTIINIMTRINQYIDNHQDNNGEEKQLIYLQKLIRKLMNCIYYAITSCGFGVLEAIKYDYISEQ